MNNDTVLIEVSADEAKAFTQLCRALDTGQKPSDVLSRSERFRSLRAKLQGAVGGIKAVLPAAVTNGKCVCAICQSSSDCIAMDYVRIYKSEVERLRAILDQDCEG